MFRLMLNPFKSEFIKSKNFIFKGILFIDAIHILQFSFISLIYNFVIKVFIWDRRPNRDLLRDVIVIGHLCPRRLERVKLTILGSRL